MPDPRDRAAEQVARAVGTRRLAEAERVEHSDRAGPHREHVPEDPADPCGSTLERLDGARMIVRFDLERHRQATADVDGAGILARSEQQVWPLGREQSQQLARMLVGAVLRPHQREHRQLHVVRLALEALDDQLVLVVGEPELAMPRRRRGRRHPL